MLPVVFTAFDHNPGIVPDGVKGLLMPRGNSSVAAAAPLRLLDDPAAAARSGEAGRAWTGERYQLSRMIEA